MSSRATVQSPAAYSAQNLSGAQIAARMSGDQIAARMSEAQIIGRLTRAGLNEFLQIFDLADYGAVGDGVADDTSAINDCYAAAKASGVRARMRVPVPAVKYRFTSQLVWDGAVDVCGENGEFCVFEKDFNGDGIKIEGVGQQSRYQDFTLTATATDATGVGILVVDAVHMTMQRLTIRGHASHGIYCNSATVSGFFSKFENLIIVDNGGDGIRLNNFYRCKFGDIQSLQNGGWGFNLLQTSAYHSGDLTCEQNTAGGSQIASTQNNLELYGESNTGPDLELTATSVRNIISNVHIDTYPGDLIDRGQNNIILSCSGVGAIFVPYLTRPKNPANGNGFDMLIFGGAAGSGAGANVGGALTIQGGDAAGTGNAKGGPVTLNGGDPIGTERRGLVAISDNANGNVVVGGNSLASANLLLECRSTTQLFRPTRMTTAQRTAITLNAADTGAIVFDTTLNAFYFVNNTPAWAAL